MPFHALILGDGNFSFSLALARLIFQPKTGEEDLQRNALAYLSLPYPSPIPTSQIFITTTSFDGHEQLVSKYHDAESILAALGEFENVKSLHGINAWELLKHFGPAAEGDQLQYRYFQEGGFDRIIWNHPHLGTEDFRLHRFLMAHFFESVASVLKQPGSDLPDREDRADEGQVCVSLVQGQEVRWDLVAQAARSNLGLFSFDPFDERHWPGYLCKRNNTGQTFKNLKTQRRMDSEMKSHVFRFGFGPSRVTAPSHSITPAAAPLPTEVPVTATLLPDEIIASPAAPASKVVCRDCGRPFNSERGLSTHQHMVHSLKLYGNDWNDVEANQHSCPVCSKSFRKASDLWQHRVNKHTTVDSQELPNVPSNNLTQEAEDEYDYYPCTTCGQAVVRRDWGMMLHLETLKPAIGLTMTCPLCSESFIEQRALYQHYRYCRIQNGLDAGSVQNLPVAPPLWRARKDEVVGRGKKKDSQREKRRKRELAEAEMLKKMQDLALETPEAAEEESE
ncbi:uncharacterized protein BJ171DRAFT_488544 [Polychytrium aggregatum]|uniref:uncharacterized protein n=1 Tax=Polychytrium aggregatum TaxID=110093 RepID=UPI0022FE9DD9|nr:uncharacterized protein BJ171DRAFT_488544 [Polychytrium aggregatum]KAI9209102.1 hypothetical protein BJ171DRAFT_488544 [Polychytrium aggregatum]